MFLRIWVWGIGYKLEHSMRNPASASPRSHRLDQLSLKLGLLPHRGQAFRGKLLASRASSLHRRSGSGPDKSAHAWGIGREDLVERLRRREPPPTFQVPCEFSGPGRGLVPAVLALGETFRCGIVNEAPRQS